MSREVHPSVPDYFTEMKEVNGTMSASGAVVLVLRDPDSPQNEPLMLKTMLFSPAARWLSMSLEQFGIQRFFVVSEPDWIDRTAACFPAGAETVPADDPQLDTRLMEFAAQCRDSIITVTEPVWLSSSACDELVNDEFLTPAGETMGVYRVEAQYLAQGGIETLNCGDYYSPLNDPEIQLLPLHGPQDLLRARQLGLADSLFRLMQSGVDIIDPNTTYVESGAQVASGSVILPNTILRGKVTAGEGCVLGPNTMLTECVLGKGCTVNASQVAFTTLPDGTSVGPFISV